MSPANSTDTTSLVELLKQQDRAGFTLLYNNYAAALLGIINKIVNDLATSEDVLQDVLVKVYKKIEQYDCDKGTFFTWLLNIARSTAIDYLRSKYHRQKQQNQSFETNNYLYDTLSETPAERSGNLGPVIKKLEPKYKEVIDLVYIEGYSQQEVSTMLNLPLGTVKTRARMALQILRKELEDDGR
jgi:RNA polymerase sigma factor (sigma-70 family)